MLAAKPCHRALVPAKRQDRNGRLPEFAGNCKEGARRATDAIMNMNSSRRSRPLAVVLWTAQVAVAAILLQTLFFKFTGAPESVYIFTAVGMEPVGRYASGVAELVAAVLLLWPRRAWSGAALALAVISGAIFFHLTRLGIEVQGDGGLLFGLALVVFVGSLAILVIRRRELPWPRRPPG